MRSIVAILLLLLVLSPSLRADQTSALINQQLDSLVSLDLKNKPLPEAMKIIGQQTGVRIDAAAGVYDLLPWGDQTTINAKVENQTLRGALSAIAQKLGLTFTLKDNYIELQPMPALAQLGQRATVRELEALDKLASTAANLPSDRVKVSALVESIDHKLVELKSPFAIENRLGLVGPDFVEGGLFELPGMSIPGMRKGTRFVSEQFTLKQLVWNRGAVHLHKWSCSAPAELMKPACRQLLSGAALPSNEDRNVRGRSLLQLSLYSQDFRGSAQ